MTEETIKYLEEWLELSSMGKFAQAKELYFKSLFPEVRDRFILNYSNLLQEDEVLISLLGLTPEPLALTAFAMQPQIHTCITQQNTGEAFDLLDNLSEAEISVIKLEKDDFASIYAALKEQLVIFNSTRVVIDITGGKKSMVASASIFAKDFGCKIVYVDFDKYLKELRRPLPGSERLKVVYDPQKDQPELLP